MAKLNKANFLEHLNPILLENKYVALSGSLNIIEPIHIQMVNIFLECSALKYIRLSENTLDGSSHKKFGKLNLPLLSGSMLDEVFIITMVYSQEKEYISFDEIDLETEEHNTEVIEKFCGILPKGWDLMLDYEPV
jgi:hypothetical protein